MVIVMIFSAQIPLIFTVICL